MRSRRPERSIDGEADAEVIVRKAMKIAGDICVYTNHSLVIESAGGA
jgi:ATP-dependent HslUV protease subunit HslV